METSDSEYFESADEDFFSDDDCHSKEIQEEKNTRSKLETLSISKNKSRVVESKTSKDKEEGTVRTSGDVKVLKEEGSDSDITCSEKTENTWDDEDSINTETEFQSSRSKIEKPPGVTSCWEPGMDYIEETDLKKITSKDGIDDTNKLEDDKESKAEKTKNARPEFGIPPARVECWEGNVRKPKEQSKSLELSRGECKIPPARETCWVEGVNTPNVRSADKLKNQDRPQPKQPVRGFSIPPEIEGCWEEGVNDLKQKSDVCSKLPSESKQSTESKQSIESKQSTESKQSVEFKQSSESKQPSESNQAIKAEGKHSTDERTRTQLEENMWDDDAWNSIVPNSSKKPPENLWDDDETNWKTVTQKTDSSMSVDAKTNDDNMWENDEDWSNVDTKKTEPKKEEDNMWEDDDWEPIENVPKEMKPSIEKKEDSSGWGAWGSWGLSSVLSTATTLTNQVSQSITTVLETGIVAPDPEEIARMKQMTESEEGNQELPNQEKLVEKAMLGFGLGNMMQGVSKLVESAGTKVISGGLDTLETIGKKTMEVLQENDPGLKKKRAFLKLDDNKPILSQVLRDAKERSENESVDFAKKHIAKKPNYEALFDDHQGLVHLEALEMLSKQCDIKLCSLLESSNGEALLEMQETMDQVKELCELPEEEEEEHLGIAEMQEKFESAVSDLNVKITYDKMIVTWREVEEWLENINPSTVDCKVIHKKAIETLAQLTAIAVEQFHKGGELLLIKDHRSTADEADALVQLTTTLTDFIGTASAKFSENLNTTIQNGANKEEVNDLITNVFFEAANSSSYVQNAFQLLIPVLQVGAV